MINPPTVVCDVRDGETLSSLTGEERPSNAILRFDGEGNVLDGEGQTLGSFSEVYEQLRGKVIPVLKLEDQAAAEAAVRLLQEDPDLLDLAVLSDQPELIKKVRTDVIRSRAILEVTRQTDPAEIVATAHENRAGVVLLPRELATAESVRYIQSRLKAVWVMAEDESAFGLTDCVATGAYGVAAADFAGVYDVLESFWEGSLARAPFNVAHRGMPKICNENSVSGTLAAVENGATHVEVDGYLTSDNEIVIMHNSTIDATTNGQGAIESMTLEEVKSYRLDQFEPEEIPTLEEIIGALKGTDVVLVFEIKSGNFQLLNVLKEKLEEQDFLDQVVVISGNTSMLNEMKRVLPQIPTANINTASAATLAETLNWMGSLNTTVDTMYTNTSVDFNEGGLRDRGIIGWYWTFADSAAVQSAFDAGYTGIANDVADVLANRTETVRGLPGTVRETLAAGDEIPVLVQRYAGGETEEKGNVFLCEDRGDRWSVIAAYGDVYIYYTEAFEVLKPGAQSKGCGSSLGTAALPAALLIPMGLALILGKKRVR